MIRFEIKKILHSSVPVFLFIFNFIGTLMGTLLFALNRKQLIDGTESLILWGQTLFYASQLFSPILIGIICSVSCQFEEKQNNWQRLLTFPLSPRQIVHAKFVSITLVSLVSQVIVLLLFFISALVLRVPLVSFSLFLSWSVTGWIGTFSIIALQLFLSIRLKQFSVPILLAAVGSILGLLSLFISQQLFTLFPYAQLAVGIRARSLVSFELPELLTFLLINTVYTVLALQLAQRCLRKRFA